MNKQIGFTLVELMISLVVAAILLSLTVTGFGSLLADNRLKTGANDLVLALNLARSEAIKRGVAVTVARNSSWAEGWVVEVASDGTDIRVFGPLESPVTLISAGGYTQFQYRATGLVNNSDTLTLCDDRSGENGRQVTINVTGLVRVRTVTCS